MTHKIAPLILAGLLTFPAVAAQAACYADYKAKQDDPLRLHYGVVELSSDCSTDAARQYLEPLLLADGWQLLEIVGVFDESALDEREEDAGDYFLRY